MNTPADVPSPIDLRSPQDALDWERTALEKRPWRTEFFQAFVEQLELNTSDGHVLELGSGPGFLALHILERLPHLRMTLLDYSAAMNDLARARLSNFISRVTFVERNFKSVGWEQSLGTFSSVITNQAVHELRHKHYASALHAQVRSLLLPGGKYLVCDHYAGEGGMSNTHLYMTVEEQRSAIMAAGYMSVAEVKRKAGLVMHSAV